MPWQKIFEQTRGDFFLVLPEAMLIFFGLAILLSDFLLTKPQKAWNALTAMLGVVFSGGSLYMLRAYAAPPYGPTPGFYNSIVVDPFFIFFGFLFLASTALVILISVRYMEIEDEQHGEYYALMLFATVGMMFLACGNDLVVLFLGLETMALSFYVLSGFLRRDRRSNEAAMKYMLMGAFSSGILAYGFSILYGLAGSTNLAVIQEAIQRRHLQFPGTDLLTFLALGTVAAGIFFKIAGVPFHQWAPDVYEGAPTGITAFVSGASKAASFVLLAYSSIAQVGYILLGFVAAVNPDGTLHERGLQAMAFYLFVYVFFNTGAFAVVILLRRKGMIGDEIDDLNGLIERSPGAAVLMLIFLLSLAGIPPTAGFVAKLLIFWALIETHHTVLAVLGVLYILPAVYYYFRRVAAMLVREASDKVQPVISWAQKVALGAMVIVTLAAGMFPEQFLRLATYSILTPFGQ